jgi:hypothetical protein
MMMSAAQSVPAAALEAPGEVENAYANARYYQWGFIAAVRSFAIAIYRAPGRETQTPRSA